MILDALEGSCLALQLCRAKLTTKRSASQAIADGSDGLVVVDALVRFP